MDFQMETWDSYGADHILRLAGSLDINSVPLVRHELGRLESDGKRNGIVLDLAELRVLDSISLGVIIHCYTCFQNQKRRFVIRNPSREISELLQISCLDQLIPIVWESHADPRSSGRSMPTA